MRDIIFFSVVCALLLFAVRRPYIAVSLWLWTGIFVPAYWLYGFAKGLSFNSLFALLTILVYIVYPRKDPVKITTTFVITFLFCLHVTITSVTNVALPDFVWSEWVKFFKIVLLMVFIILIIRDRNHFKYLCTVFVFSLGVMGVIEGLKFFSSAGSHHIKGPDNHILSDNNHFALVLCMIIPITIYLLSQYKEKYIRLTMIGVLVLCVMSILGTQSRGGFIGLSCISFFFWMRSKRKLLTIVGFLIVAAVASQFLTDKWFNRMNTIENADQDGSFMIRVKAWKMYTLMAMERPLVGGGFRAMQHGHVWRSVAPNFSKLSFIKSPEPGEKGWAAHSIYFQVLGDHGFLGLFLFLCVIASAIFSLRNIMKKVQDIEGARWQAELAKMMQLSIIAFCVGGAALSLPYFEVIWVFIAMTIALKNSALASVAAETQRKKAQKPDQEAIPAPAMSGNAGRQYMK
ncbi:putative O-glycosylation ligase, exosortase A system-associated [Photobacterium ganghwense]|uniref:putative O-glycosylation ligase, exosortase A system-associated n=1 Tax=Photobacterium ganghwense TaxID=320778 RepID=UPI001C2CC85E|nr:putative O-glycosylation ligase, exosortase A system-associated [Photobacterium ganghwense]MBV1842059.1 putative O-glycosylation ligase, exosortase A system-associated [Photobacterium ganghwense]